MHGWVHDWLCCSLGVEPRCGDRPILIGLGVMNCGEGVETHGELPINPLTGFPDFDAAAGQLPVQVIGAAHQQNLAIRVMYPMVGGADLTSNGRKTNRR